MKIYNNINLIVKYIKRTFKYKVLYILLCLKYIIFVYNIMLCKIKGFIYNGLLFKELLLLYRYHSSILLLIKKIIIRWGTVPIFFNYATSDNIHYVNLLPNQHSFHSKVVCHPYFEQLFRKIITGGGTFEGAITISLKILKSLSLQPFWKKKIKKGLSLFSSSTMCRRSSSVAFHRLTMLVCKACSGADSFDVSAIVVPRGHDSQKNGHIGKRGLTKPFPSRRVLPHKNGTDFISWGLRYA
jgi:hypothetical protein